MLVPVPNPVHPVNLVKKQTSELLRHIYTGDYHHILRRIQVKLTTFAFYCLTNNFDIKVNSLIYMEVVSLYDFWPDFCLFKRNYIQLQLGWLFFPGSCPGF